MILRHVLKEITKTILLYIRCYTYYNALFCSAFVGESCLLVV